MSSLPNTVLDKLLTLQLGVAWAGEARCDPPRLGWWQTDVVDEYGGGDLFQRLMPRTHAWASLQAVRLAAQRYDAAARARLTDPDSVRTLFHFGFEIDEQLDERLQELKRSGRSPQEALSTLPDLESPFSRDGFHDWLAANGKPAFEIEAHGRQLAGSLPPPELAAEKLAGALLPFADQYPLPFFRFRDATASKRAK